MISMDPLHLTQMETLVAQARVVQVVIHLLDLVVETHFLVAEDSAHLTLSRIFLRPSHVKRVEGVVVAHLHSKSRCLSARILRL